MTHDAEAFFEQVLIRFGFSRVSDDVGHNPTFNNADFVNKKSRTILEIKTLEKDFLPDGGVIPSIRALIMQPKFECQVGLCQYSIKFPAKDEKHEGS